MQGLPIGSIYLLHRDGNEISHGAGSDALNTTDAGEGWYIFDGQQRLRTLLLGKRGPCLEPGVADKRCLWVEVLENGTYRLRLTTESQPFGYDPTSQGKMSVGDRRSARRQIEQEPKETSIKKVAGQRRAYNHELFKGFIEDRFEFSSGNIDSNHLKAVGCWEKGWPPLPYSAKGHNAYPLHRLLGAWLDGGVENRKARLRNSVSTDQNKGFVDRHDEAFKRVADAEIAIGNLKSLQGNAVMTLYNRIGAGGTPLSAEEMLFSIYKFHEAKIHDAVNALYNDPTVGRAMAPTKIAAAAIRIANALSHSEQPEDGNWLPSVDAFSKEMLKDGSKIKNKLGELLGAERGTLNVEHTKFGGAFELLFKFIALREIPFDAGLPRVMMITLSPRLLEVLLLWVIKESELNHEVIESQRADILRFIMFWRLCVTNEDKASTLCFVRIKKAAGFLSVASLFETIVAATEQIATPLVDPTEMEVMLCRNRSHVWRTENDRFSTESTPQWVTARRWWYSGQSTLIWLQRAYLNKQFPDFDPATGRDDDTPYDADHMVPHSDWGRYWTPFCTDRVLPELTKFERDAIRDPALCFGKFNRESSFN